jgi:hypothetical protein
LQRACSIMHTAGSMGLGLAGMTASPLQRPCSIMQTEGSLSAALFVRWFMGRERADAARKPASKKDLMGAIVD